MIPLSSPELTALSQTLKKYDLRSTVSQLAGLLTAPDLQANTVRIETLVHLAVMHCTGRRKPGMSEIRNWLNRHLGNTYIANIEDPVEDVFVTLALTPEGNRRIFEGIWESNDYFLQVVLDTLNQRKVPKECREVLSPAFALLRLSDCIAERLGLLRWDIQKSVPKKDVRIAPTTRLDDRARAVTFTELELNSLGASLEALAPFILANKDKLALTGESTGDSSLELHPLVNFDGELVFALPHAASPAIRRFVLSNLGKMGYLRAFDNALAVHQAQQVEQDCFREFRGESESLMPPEPDGHIPALHSWLLKYDINKYLHVALLHDKVTQLEKLGLSSFMQYSEKDRKALAEYFIKVSDHCQGLSNFVEGMTLVVMGGLGRGFGITFDDWPEDWRLSVIRISDLIMLASETDKPISRYLKFIKQKEWAEKEGVEFFNVNGDFNFYCYWRNYEYQLIPRELQVSNSSLIVIGNDMVLPVREEIRNLADKHVIQTVNGFYTSVMRFGSDSYFKSMQSRPIYASLGHLQEGVLAGVVETSHGPNWLLVIPRKIDAQISFLLYEMWSGFIGLYDKLVFEVEALQITNSHKPLEIRLDFADLAFNKDYVASSTDSEFGTPSVVINLEQRIAEIHFPSDFLMHFQKPENTGEILVMRAIAMGLLCIHKGVTNEIDETVINALMDKVISHPGMRVIHLFRTYYPIEYLLTQRAQKPTFLAPEDFVFSKLTLSQGCTVTHPGKPIISKSECNKFLHNVVDKIWGEIKARLQQLDRTSVINEVLKVHEAIIQDRSHWSRTAQAVLALYASEEDVYAVARERESDRNNVALPARTILEMAICECSAEDGLQLSRGELGELLAKAALLIEVATDSDAVNSDLVEPRIELHQNGEYSIDRRFHSTVIQPFLAGYFREMFEEAAEGYIKLYQSENLDSRTRADEVYSASFISAFHIEFGLTPDEAIDGVAELMEIAVKDESVVVETKLGDLKKRLITTRGMSSQACEAFINTFAIFHRPAWDKPPSGFCMRDIIPWRFRRRLSCVARPILIFGHEDNDKVLYGAGALKLGFNYLMERSERGHLPQEFFVSQEMKQYIGTVNGERGLEFARTVANQMTLDGWKTRNEVRMTELGAPAEFGDVDVLAWKDSGEIQIIECKRLQLARTVAEVAEICRRFRGEAKDELDKHVQRVNWIKSHLSGLQRIVGFPLNRANIDHRLITNTHVPMMYLTSLPIEADKIESFKDLQET